MPLICKMAKKKQRDTMIAFPPLPMLAKDYLDHPLKEQREIKVLQPKLDGVRLVAWCDAHEQQPKQLKLTSRTGKSMDHLMEEFGEPLNALFGAINAKCCDGKVRLIALDGELYVDDVKIGFQQVVSMVRNTQTSQSIKDGRINLKYFVYDALFVVDDDDDKTFHCSSIGFLERYRMLASVMKSDDYLLQNPGKIVLLDNLTEEARVHADVESALESCLSKGYEGVMIRDASSAYEPGGKRSSSLLKYKRFVDSEFPIVGFTEATGKDAGTVIWECCTNTKRFNVRPTGTLSERREMLANAQKHADKFNSGKIMLTVRYQELTDCGIPRFPVGIVVRDYE